MTMIFLPFLLSLGLSCCLVPIVRFYSLKFGFIAQPRKDRWHKDSTATLGGIAIFTAFLFSLIIFSLVEKITNNTNSSFEIQWSLLVGSLVVFLLGLYDDLKELTPPIKLIGQIFAAAIIIYSGYTTKFFTPRIENTMIAQIPNVILTFIWVVGVTNAINLIDNMDGLAGGISLIAALFLSFFFIRVENFNLSVISLAIAGSVLGFLFFNFPPAKIFMGDSGSLFLGFTLGVLAIARQPQASNVLAVLGIPTLIFLIPILDTIMVFFTRLLRGVSPIDGGRDHTSHRLVAFGFSERKALIILYGIATFTGWVAFQLELIKYWYSLVIVPILIVSFTLFISFLGGMKIVPKQDNNKPLKGFPRIIGELTYRRSILEIIFDFFLIGIAYYLSFLFSFNLNMNDERLDLFINTLPVVLIGVFLSFIIFGVYKLVWRYTSVEDFLRYLQASVGGIFIVSVSINLLYPDYFFLPRQLLFFFFILFSGLVASRYSFRLFQMTSNRQFKPDVQKIVIFGSGDSGELAMRWAIGNLHSDFRPIGFLAVEKDMVGRQIHGLPVIGEKDKIPYLIAHKKISGIIISPEFSNNEQVVQEIQEFCIGKDCWVKKLHVELLD